MVIATTYKLPYISPIKLRVNDMTYEERTQAELDEGYDNGGIAHFEELMIPRIAWLNARKEELDEKRQWSPGVRDQFENTMNAYYSIHRRLRTQFDIYQEHIDPLPRWNEIPELLPLGLSPYQHAFKPWSQEVHRLIQEYENWNDEMVDLIKIILDLVAHSYQREETVKGKKKGAYGTTPTNQESDPPTH